MASYFCPRCDIHWPKHQKANDCPHCGYSTSYEAAGKPHYHVDDLDSIVSLKEKLAAFEAWCKENGREGLPPEPPASIRFVGRTGTRAELLYASSVVGMLDRAGHYPTELHVL